MSSDPCPARECADAEPAGSNRGVGREAWSLLSRRGTFPGGDAYIRMAGMGTGHGDGKGHRRVGAEQEQLWVLRAQSGDREAFAKLVELYQVPIHNLAYRMLGSAAEAEDATQETFLRAYTRLDTYDPRRKFSSWILSIASHHCVDRLRRRRGNWLSTEEIQAWHWVPDQDPKPETVTIGHEQRDAIRRLLDQLPPHYRLVIVLRYWYELSYEEMAEVTQSTRSAIKSRLHRARRAMAIKLAEAQVAKRVEGAAEERRVGQNALSRGF